MWRSKASSLHKSSLHYHLHMQNLLETNPKFERSSYKMEASHQNCQNVLPKESSFITTQCTDQKMCAFQPQSLPTKACTLVSLNTCQISCTGDTDGQLECRLKKYCVSLHHESQSLPFQCDVFHGKATSWSVLQVLSSQQYTKWLVRQQRQTNVQREAEGLAVRLCGESKTQALQ